MIQQGQVFKLKARCADGEPLWAYRYRVAGRGSARLQVGGFSTRAEAQRALQNKLARLLPGGRSTTLTLGELVEGSRRFASSAAIFDMLDSLQSGHDPQITMTSLLVV